MDFSFVFFFIFPSDVYSFVYNTVFPRKHITIVFRFRKFICLMVFNVDLRSETEAKHKQYLLYMHEMVPMIRNTRICDLGKSQMLFTRFYMFCKMMSKISFNFFSLSSDFLFVGENNINITLWLITDWLHGVYFLWCVFFTYARTTTKFSRVPSTNLFPWWRWWCVQVHCSAYGCMAFWREINEKYTHVIRDGIHKFFIITTRYEFEPYLHINSFVGIFSQLFFGESRKTEQFFSLILFGCLLWQSIYRSIEENASRRCRKGEKIKFNYWKCQENRKSWDIMYLLKANFIFALSTEKRQSCLDKQRKIVHLAAQSIRNDFENSDKKWKISSASICLRIILTFFCIFKSEKSLITMHFACHIINHSFKYEPTIKVNCCSIRHTKFDFQSSWCCYWKPNQIL